MGVYTGLIENINQNPWIVFITMIFTLLGVIIAVFFYLKGRRLKEPRYSFRSHSLIKDFTQQINGLGITFAGQPISSLMVTKMAFWNRGKDTINSSDIPMLDPFEIKIQDQYEILSAELILKTNESNQAICSIYPDKKTVKIAFDYFDQNDGFVLQILHTGEKTDNLKISGTVKGVGKICKNIIMFEPIYIRLIEKIVLKKKKK